MRIKSHSACKNGRHVEMLISLHVKRSLLLREEVTGTLVTQPVTPTRAGSRLDGMEGPK